VRSQRSKGQHADLGVGGGAKWGRPGHFDVLREAQDQAVLLIEPDLGTLGSVLGAGVGSQPEELRCLHGAVRPGAQQPWSVLLAVCRRPTARCSYGRNTSESWLK